MSEWLNNPLTYVLALAVGGLIIRGLFWLRDVHNAKEGWGAIVTEIRADIKEIFKRLPPLPAPVSASSPLKLTEFGRKMSESMDATAWARALAPTLQGNIAGKRAFEIDAFSRDYVREHMDRDERVAKCMDEMGVERDAALRVLQVVLRDELLKVAGQVIE